MALHILDESHFTGKIKAVLVDSNIMESCFVDADINNTQIVSGDLYTIPGSDINMEVVKYISSLKKH